MLKNVFSAYDTDGSGSVDLDEFVNSASFKNSHLASSADSMFELVDKDSSGEITLDELMKVYFRYASKKDLQAMHVSTTSS